MAEGDEDQADDYGPRKHELRAAEHDSETDLGGSDDDDDLEDGVVILDEADEEDENAEGRASERADGAPAEGEQAERHVPARGRSRRQPAGLSPANKRMADRRKPGAKRTRRKAAGR
jgi:hypothetical protein